MFTWYLNGALLLLISEQNKIANVWEILPNSTKELKLIFTIKKDLIVIIIIYIKSNLPKFADLWGEKFTLRYVWLYRSLKISTNSRSLEQFCEYKRYINIMTMTIFSYPVLREWVQGHSLVVMLIELKIHSFHKPGCTFLSNEFWQLQFLVYELCPCAAHCRALLCCS